jgi:hypothetical protein
MERQHGGRSGKKTAMAVVLFGCLMARPAEAFDRLFPGPRAMGMAGANVASVKDTTAQYYNPAAFGFFHRSADDGGPTELDNNDVGRKSWGKDLNVAAGVMLHNGFGRHITQLADIDPDELSQGVRDQEDLADIVNLVNSLEGISKPGSAITLDMTFGLGVRVGHFAIGARGYTLASGRVDFLDRHNLGFDIPPDELRSEITAVQMDEGYSSAGYRFRIFTTEQRLQLADAFGVAADDEAIKRLDYIAAAEGMESRNVSGAVNLLSAAISASGGNGNLDENTSTVLLKGFGMAEIPLSYGYAFNDHLAIGANLKLMQGRVYGNRLIVFDEEADEISSQTTERYRETSTVGIDVGALARFPSFNLGLVGRNLNSPRFAGFRERIDLNSGTMDLRVKGVRLKPQLTAGVAYLPFTTLTLEANLDLTESDTLIPGYRNRNLSLGLEWDVYRVLAMRAGTYKNLSESDIGWVYTAGLGLNLWAIRLDVAGAFAAEKEEFEGNDIPRETRVSAQLSVDF